MKLQTKTSRLEEEKNAEITPKLNQTREKPKKQWKHLIDVGSKSLSDFLIREQQRLAENSWKQSSQCQISAVVPLERSGKSFTVWTTEFMN